MSIETLRKISLQSVKWITLGNLIQNFTTPVLSVWIATILSPQNYGIVAIGGVFVGFATLLEGLGVRDFLVKEKELDQKKLNTAFWTNVFLAVCLWLLLFILSPFISNLYNEPMLIYIIPVSSIIILFDAFGNVQQALLRRNLEFKKLFLRNIVPIVIDHL